MLLIGWQVMVFKLNEFIKSCNEVNRKTRRAVFDLLPIEWTIRERVRVASKVVKISSGEWPNREDIISLPKDEADIASRIYTFRKINELDNHLTVLNKRKREQSKRYRELNEAIDHLDRVLNSSLIMNSIIIDAIERTGISIENFTLAMETLDVARKEVGKSVDIEKMESRKKRSLSSVHDISVGLFLIAKAIPRKTAAGIIAKMAQINPLARNYLNPQRIDDLKKAKASINQTLRNYDL